MYQMEIREYRTGICCDTSFRANYVAMIFRQANGLMLQFDAPVDHGWNEAGPVRWSDTWYSEDISELLLNQVEVSKELEAENVKCSDCEEVFCEKSGETLQLCVDDPLAFPLILLISLK